MDPWRPPPGVTAAGSVRVRVHVAEYGGHDLVERGRGVVLRLAHF
jgi:hypothetical protein